MGPTQTSEDRTERRWSLSTLGGNGGIAFFLASVVANGANFAFHMVMSRMLGPAVYGALGSLLGITNVISFALGALQAAVVQAVTLHHRRHGQGRKLSLGTPMRVAVSVGVGCSLLAFALSPLLGSYLHLASITAIILLGLFLTLSVITILPTGVLLGRLQFSQVASSLVAGAAVRMAAGPVLVSMGQGLNGAMAASVLGSVVTLAVALWFVRADVMASPSSETLPLRLGPATLAVFALTGVSAFTGIDTFMARHYLPGVVSGWYAAGATAGRITLFLPAAITSLAFPRFVAHQDSGGESRRLLLHAVVLTALLSSAATIFLAAFPRLVIDLLFGVRYLPAISVVGTLAIAALWTGVASVLVYYHLARHSWLSPAAWLGVAAAAATVAMFHSSMVLIARIMLVISGAVVLILTLGTSDSSRRHHSTVRRLADDANVDSAPASSTGPEISIVVPYYNPGARLRSTVSELIEVLGASGAQFEVIAVSDGSTDGSDDDLDTLTSDSLRNIRLPANAGKGQALREGLSQARGAYLGFIDADGDIPPSIVNGFLEVIRAEHPDIIIGSKRHPNSSVVYPPIRRFYSWGYQQLVRVLFRLSVRDTQTGLKFTRREVLAEVLPRMVEKRFAFDLELLVVARHCGYRRVAEAPVVIRERFTTTVSLRSVRKTLLDTLAIFYRLHFLRYYDRSSPMPELVDDSGSTRDADRVVA